MQRKFFVSLKNEAKTGRKILRCIFVPFMIRFIHHIEEGIRDEGKPQP